MPEQLDANDVIAALPCAIKMPDNWGNFFARGGPLPPMGDDHRRFPRFYLRAPAALRYRSTLPALPRPDHECMIYLKDVSRTSIAFLHSEQLFPKE